VRRQRTINREITEVFKKLLADQSGNFFYSAVIIIVILFVADITWVATTMVKNTFLDTWAQSVVENAQMVQFDGVLRTSGAIVIVVINVGLIALLIVSAWKRQTVEAEDLAL
jgi:hypothetical protein